MSRRWLPNLALFAAFALFYIGAGKLGLSLAIVNASVSPVWPPTGLALAGLLIFGNRLWPAVFVGAFVVNVTTHSSVPTSYAVLVANSFVIASGNTLEAVVGAMLARRFASGAAAFEQVRDIFRFVAIAAIPGTILSATIGVASLASFGLLPWSSFGSVWFTWWTGDFVSDLTVAPLLLTWAIAPWPRFELRKSLEAWAMAILVMFATALRFGPWSNKVYSLPFAMVPLLLWAAFRYRQRGAISASCLMAAVAVWYTQQGVGPFATDSPNDSLLLLQTFMGTNALTMLVLAAVIAERQRMFAEREQLLERERAARQDAERANTAKDDFLAILSHELRTPLTPVMLAATMLERDASVPEHIQRDLKMIRRNVELEARLIDDLLDLTRIGNNKLTLHRRALDAHDVINRAVEICCRDGREAAGIDLEFAADSHHVLADEGRLQQVFWNLLSNARKFTPPTGSIIVRTYNDCEGSIIAEVTDSGIGIEPDVLPRLFTAFEQGQSPHARRAGGLGLGLAICKALVTAHGGSLNARSEGRGKGSTFSVQLATVSKTSAQPSNGGSVATKASQRSLRILLVEDHESTLHAIKELLEQRTHIVTPAGSVAAALEAAQRETFDLIITDIGLPDGRGHDIMRSINTRQPVAGIAISGYGTSTDIQHSSEAGFAEHLTKPVNLDTLEAAIGRAISAVSRPS